MSETVIQLDPETARIARELIKELRDEAHGRKWGRAFRTIGMFTIAVIVIGFFVAMQLRIWGWELQAPPAHVAVVAVNGVIGQGPGNAEQLTKQIEKAFTNPRAKAVVLHIDSPGGSPQHAQRIGQAARMHAERSGKPLVAHIDGLGASAAYLIAMHADTIIASQYSLTGSIGAVMSVYDWHELADRFGVRMRTYASGGYKDFASPWHAPDAQGEAYANELVAAMGDRFATDVQILRAGRLKAGAAELASGKVWMSQQALDMGLIDGIATLDTFVAQQFSLPMERVQVRQPLVERVGFSAMVERIVANALSERWGIE